MKKVNAIQDAKNSIGDIWFRCSNCKYDEILPDHKYCANCGGKIENFLEEYQNDRT